MKKQYTLGLWLLCFLFLLPGCVPKSMPSADTPTSSGGLTAEPSYTLEGIIVNADEDACLIAGSPAGALFTVSLKDHPAVTGTEALTQGQRVKLTYTGAIRESHPAQINSPLAIEVLADDWPLIDLFIRITHDLYDADPALVPAPGSGTLAFDLAQVNILNDGQKGALVYLAAQRYGLTGIMGTLDELKEQGYIDSDGFKDGVLFSFNISDVTDTSFTFSPKSWMNGRGAVGFSQSQATKSEDTWEYTLSGLWLS